MPKKTRSEKIISDLRRKLQTTVANTSLPNATPIETPKIHLTTAANINSVRLAIPTPTRTVSNDYSYVWADLHRITILTIIAVGLEFILYIMLPRLNLLSM